MTDTCCSPNRDVPDRDDTVGAPRADPPTPEPRAQSSLITVPALSFRMGDESGWAYPADGEGPVHDVDLPSFRIDRFAVSNARFAEFVDATGWRTEAERYEWSFVFGGLLPEEFPPTRGVDGAPWWRQVFGAQWRHPEGPQSDIADRMDHPVVHVSWNDAQAFCAWSGTRLPSEAEWEAAARGGLVGQPFPWGDELEPAGAHAMNVFQGDFPTTNTGADGYRGTAPVDAYRPNGFGLYNTTGNVWEWCADWRGLRYYENSPTVSPPGPDHGTERVQRGGSYLCHASYCRRYRVSARFGSDAESSSGNVGFRIAADL